MNAIVKVISGTFSIVAQIDDDKIDQIAAILGLADADKASLKGNGLLVCGPLPEGSDGSN
jgi:hypothetical protein